MPADVKELALTIGKGCPVPVAQKVKSMFTEDEKYVNRLTHDYIEKISEELQEVGDFTKLEVKKGVDDFIKICEDMKQDVYLMQIISQKNDLNQEGFADAIDKFKAYKIATGEYRKYDSREQIRKNLIFYIPYYKKQQKNEPTTIAGFSTNSKSVTSKLAGW